MMRGHYPFFTFTDKRLSEIINPEVSASIIDRDSTTDYDLAEHWIDEDDGFVVLDCVSPSNDQPS